MISEDDAKAAIRDMVAAYDALLAELEKHFPDELRNGDEYARLQTQYQQARKWLMSLLVDSRH